MLSNVGDFRLLDRRCINALVTLRESERYTKGLYCWIGYKKTFVEFETKERIAGESSWSMMSLIKLAVDGLTSFTTIPLRIATIIGGGVSLIAFLCAIYFLVKTILFGDTVTGFPTLICVILFLGGIQLLCIGIVGEYIARMFNETKLRPIYFIREYNGELK